MVDGDRTGDGGPCGIHPLMAAGVHPISGPLGPRQGPRLDLDPPWTPDRAGRPGIQAQARTRVTTARLRPGPASRACGRRKALAGGETLQMGAHPSLVKVGGPPARISRPQPGARPGYPRGGSAGPAPDERTLRPPERCNGAGRIGEDLGHCHRQGPSLSSRRRRSPGVFRLVKDSASSLKSA